MAFKRPKKIRKKDFLEYAKSHNLALDKNLTSQRKKLEGHSFNEMLSIEGSEHFINCSHTFTFKLFEERVPYYKTQEENVAIETGQSAILAQENIYTLPKSKTSFTVEGYGRISLRTEYYLWDSKEDIEKFIASIKKQRKKIEAGKRVHHACDPENFTYGEEFLEKVPELVEALKTKTFKFSQDKPLDYTQDSLDTLSRKMNGKGRDALNDDTEYYAQLIAYLGEYIRHTKPGSEWRIRHIDDGNNKGWMVWEPYMLEPNGAEWDITSKLQGMATDDYIGLNNACIRKISDSPRNADAQDTDNLLSKISYKLMNFIARP